MILCMLCNEGAESKEHLFFQCKIVVEVWCNVLHGMRYNDQPSSWQSEMQSQLKAHDVVQQVQILMFHSHIGVKNISYIS